VPRSHATWILFATAWAGISACRPAPERVRPALEALVEKSGCPGPTPKIVLYDGAKDLSATEQCAMVWAMKQKIAAMPDAPPHVAPGDTASVAYVSIFGMIEHYPDTGQIDSTWQLNADVPGRPRRFAVSIDRSTGKVSELSVVHR
jgi:hypothetical protein